MMKSRLWLLLIILMMVAGSCAKKIVTREEAEREAAFPDMSFESQSPKRRASLEFTQEGFRESEGGMYVRAMKKFEKAIDVDPSNPFAYFHYGVARYGMHEYEQSLRLFDEARDKFGENQKWQSRIYTYQGLNYKSIGNIDKARECFKKAFELDKKNEEARQRLMEIGEK